MSLSITNKIKKIINNFEFSLIKISSKYIDDITSAFIVIADPTYNGHTSRLNKTLDDLPEKKTDL